MVKTATSQNGDIDHLLFIVRLWITSLGTIVVYGSDPFQYNWTVE